MKKEPSPAQLEARRKFAEAARLRSRKSKEVAPSKEVILSEENVDLVKRVKELEDLIRNLPKAQAPEVQVRGGALVGTVERYIVDPAYYPDPRERLAKESRLARFAFDQNYDLTWKIETTQYETIDGIRQKEPRFVIELLGIVRDPETDEPTQKRYVISRGTFHEDPQAAIIVARENNLEVDESNQRLFLDEMRYLRIRDWLLENFYPPKDDSSQKNKHEEVIGNRLVTVYEKSSESSIKVPFDELSKKL